MLFFTPPAIIGGNPAKEVNKRFSDEEIAKLKEIRWFDWKRESIEAATHLLTSSSIDELYEYYLREIKE
ncbi:chloramphenicol acetyltransferase [Neobacillus bataviensis LMG 21833]|uniref:Chloramphenicol acetyltransferase n=1 Tax=Neobacillus bataviensis LMG 21833 TaxID=1117379 RepID=K6E7R2_9BACI|nr:hypothetical protein [Neobacillus bataviensis]EKN69351.1 chloramphenicol acetyltransferase [Neobacillus bataviensis LMG 21833]